jgi:hypothetical protein
MRVRGLKKAFNWSAHLLVLVEEEETRLDSAPYDERLNTAIRRRKAQNKRIINIRKVDQKLPPAWKLVLKHW